MVAKLEASLTRRTRIYIQESKNQRTVLCPSLTAVDPEPANPGAPGSGDPYDLDAERLALALQSTDLGFWDFDFINLEGPCTKACAKILGYLMLLSRTRSVTKLARGDFTLKITQSMQRKRRHKILAVTAFPEFELRIHNPDGSVRWATRRKDVFYQ